MKPIEEIKKTTNLFIKAETENDGMGGTYYDSVSGKYLHFIFSYQMGWEHLSVSMPNKTPTWEQMCRMKDIFWNKNETCVEYHPAESQYVNMHKHCLHIWRPIYCKEFCNDPESTEELLPVPPHIMVGFRNEEEKNLFLEEMKKMGIKVNPWNYKK